MAKNKLKLASKKHKAIKGAKKHTCQKCRSVYQHQKKVIDALRKLVDTYKHEH